jgi:hypothetical protein
MRPGDFACLGGEDMPLKNTPMIPNSVPSEHARLQRRTVELHREHAALALDKLPFNQASHDAHNADLRQHHSDLRAHAQELARLAAANKSAR